MHECSGMDFGHLIAPLNSGALGLCCFNIISPIIILRNSENIWPEVELRNLPLFTPSITDWNIKYLCKLVNQNFEEGRVEKMKGQLGQEIL